MDTYIQDSIQRLINESKILIVPENSTIEDALQHEDEYLLDDNNLKFEEQFREHPVTVINLLPEDNDDDFEQIYQYSKAKKLNLTVSLNITSFYSNAYNRTFLDSRAGRLLVPQTQSKSRLRTREP